LNGVNPVPDSYFTASSEYQADWPAHAARLDGNSNAWGPIKSNRDTCFLQVNCVDEYIDEKMKQKLRPLVTSSYNPHSFSVQITIYHTVNILTS